MSPRNDAQHRCDQHLALHLGMVEPQQRQAVEAAADRLAERYQLAVGDGWCELNQERDVGCPLSESWLASP